MKYNFSEKLWESYYWWFFAEIYNFKADIINLKNWKFCEKSATLRPDFLIKQSSKILNNFSRSVIETRKSRLKKRKKWMILYHHRKKPGWTLEHIPCSLSTPKNIPDNYEPHNGCLKFLLDNRLYNYFLRGLMNIFYKEIPVKSNNNKQLF